MPGTIRSIVGRMAPPQSGDGAAGVYPSASAAFRLVLVAFAIGGSCLYGGSLSWVLPHWHVVASAAWLALSAGLAWMVFIPALVFIVRRPFHFCFDACLVTMAAGEVVLVSGALANALASFSGATAHAAAVNAAIVGLSNLTMAAVLAAQLHRAGVPVARTLISWMLILNGSGALFFALLYTLLNS